MTGWVITIIIPCVCLSRHPRRDIYQTSSNSDRLLIRKTCKPTVFLLRGDANFGVTCCRSTSLNNWWHLEKLVISGCEFSAWFGTQVVWTCSSRATDPCDPWPLRTLETQRTQACDCDRFYHTARPGTYNLMKIFQWNKLLRPWIRCFEDNP